MMSKNIPSRDVYQSILRFIPKKYIHLIALSGKDIPVDVLKSYDFDLSVPQLCTTLQDKDFHALIENVNLDKQTLLECVVYKGSPLWALKILLKNPKLNFMTKKGDYIQYIAMNRNNNAVVRELWKDPRSREKTVGFIYWAAKNGEIEILREASVYHIRSDISEHALLVAAENGHLAVVDWLLKNPKVDPSFNNNETLRKAAENGRLKIVELLLQDPRVDPMDHEYINYNALELAVVNNHPRVVKKLMLDPRVDPSLPHNSAIIDASRLDYIGVVNELLNDDRVYKDDSYEDEYHSKDKSIDTALFYAGKNGNLKMVKSIMHKKGKNGLSIANPSNLSVIIFAVGSGHLSVVNELLKDPRVNPATEWNRPIILASERGYLNIVKRLLKESKVDPSYRENEAILNAFNHGHLKIVEELLKDPRLDQMGRFLISKLIRDNKLYQNPKYKNIIANLKSGRLLK